MGKIRMAKPDDAEALLRIYTPYVEDSVISFELEAPSLEDFSQRVANTVYQWPWLVCEVEGQILGYAYASVYRPRAAYAWAVETSAYVGEQHHQKGIARALYTSLLMMLELQGYYTAYAGITLPNEASVGFHESMGYEAIGVFRQAGFKLGKWHDVGWWQYLIATGTQPASHPKTPQELSTTPEWTQALRKGENAIRKT